MRGNRCRSSCGRRILRAGEPEFDALNPYELVEARQKLRRHGVELRAPIGVRNLDHQRLQLAGEDTGSFGDGASGGKVPRGLGQLLGPARSSVPAP